MRPEFEKYSLIDDYLNGKMSAQESHVFEQNMTNDPALREDVLDRKLTNEIIIENRFFDITTGIRTAPTGVKPLVSSSIKRFIGIGAAVSVILLTPYYFSKRSEKQEHEASEANNAITAPVSPQAEDETIVSEESIMLEEQMPGDTSSTMQEMIATEDTAFEETLPENTVKPTVKPKSVKRKRAKSVILEIPIDDPNAKGRSDNAYSFSMSKKQSWKVPSKQKEASLTIFDKDGTEVYGSTILAGKNSYWTGTRLDGTKLKAGKYAYLLDFGNGNIEHGQVTINP